MSELPPPPPPQQPTPLLSPDGRWYWTGTQWSPVQQPLAPPQQWVSPQPARSSPFTSGMLGCFGVMAAIIIAFVVLGLGVGGCGAGLIHGINNAQQQQQQQAPASNFPIVPSSSTDGTFTAGDCVTLTSAQATKAACTGTHDAQIIQVIHGGDTCPSGTSEFTVNDGTGNLCLDTGNSRH